MKRRAGFAAAVIATVLLGAAAAHATPIILNPGPTLAATPAALDAFNRAALTWGGYLSDPITVNISANLADMGSPTILGSTSPVFIAGGYNLIRNQMVADAAGDPNDAIVASLPTAEQFSAYVPAGFGLNGSIGGTKANLKAMGFGGLDANFGLNDATMTFNSGFNFDYDSSDGITGGYYDFETIALHEIGHVLGFVSAVDTIDYHLSRPQTGNIYIYPLDLFRFRTSDMPTAADFTTNPRSLLPGDGAAFSDLDNVWAFSTGLYTGDRLQASHWKADELTGTYIGLMDPTLVSGVTEMISYADLRALDVIGWELQTAPVPEPASLLLFGTGLVGLRAWRKRRQ